MKKQKSTSYLELHIQLIIKSQVDHTKQKIYRNLSDLYDKNKINHAFLINKNGKLFEWNIKKEIYGNEIHKLPEIKDLTQSNLDIRRLVKF